MLFETANYMIQSTTPPIGTPTPGYVHSSSESRVLKKIKCAMPDEAVLRRDRSLRGSSATPYTHAELQKSTIISG